MDRLFCKRRACAHTVRASGPRCPVAPRLSSHLPPAPTCAAWTWRALRSFLGSICDGGSEDSGHVSWQIRAPVSQLGRCTDDQRCLQWPLRHCYFMFSFVPSLPCCVCPGSSDHFLGTKFCNVVWSPEHAH